MPGRRREQLAGPDDRNPAELIQELRVVSLGVQVLSGLLPPLPFTVRSGRLGTGSATSAWPASCRPPRRRSCCSGRSPSTGWCSGRAEKTLVKSANLMAILGMAAVGAAMRTAVPLVTGVVAGVLAVALITAVMACARQPVVRPAADPAR